MDAFKTAESPTRCELGQLFTDVYGEPEPWNTSITEQRDELGALLRKYRKTYKPWLDELAKFKNNGL